MCVRESKPYFSYILDNPIYEYCLAHGLNWKSNIYYVTYDFETKKQVIDERTGK